MSGLAVEPDEMGLKLVGNMRAIGRGDQHIAARQLDLVGQNQVTRLTFHRLGQIAALGHDAGDARGLAGFGSDTDRRPPMRPPAT